MTFTVSIISRCFFFFFFFFLDVLGKCENVSKCRRSTYHRA